MIPKTSDTIGNSAAKKNHHIYSTIAKGKSGIGERDTEAATNIKPIKIDESDKTKKAINSFFTTSPPIFYLITCFLFCGKACLEK